MTGIFLTFCDLITDYGERWKGGRVYIKWFSDKNVMVMQKEKK
jgi:hypothetical protein